MCRNLQRQRTAFTLIELLVVIAIIAILIALRLASSIFSWGWGAVRSRIRES